MITHADVWHEILAFIFAGLVFQYFGRMTGWYHPYPWDDFFPMCFGYGWGAYAVRRRFNKRIAERSQ